MHYNPSGFYCKNVIGTYMKMTSIMDVLIVDVLNFMNYLQEMI